MDEQEHRAERVEALLDLGRYADAAAVARTELARCPGSATLHQLLAQALIGQEDVPAALVHARAAAELEPESPDALRVLAGTLAEVGEGALAREAALRAVHLAPDEWLSHLVHAHALLFGVRGRGILGEAEAAARRAIELGPHEPQAHVVFGIARWRLNDFAMAETAFRHALTIDPTDADAQRNLASLQIDSGSIRAGSQTLTSALASHPQDRGMHDELGRAHSRLLGAQAAWAACFTLVFGGLMMVGEDAYPLRIWLGTFTVVAAVVHIGKAHGRMPRGSWARILPWRSEGRLAPWIAWGLNSLSALVWFTPPVVALPAWCALAVCSTAIVLFLMVALLIGDVRAAEGP